MDVTSAQPFASAGTRARRLTVLLAVTIVLDLLGILSSFAEIDLLSKAMQGVALGTGEADANDLRQGIIGILQFIAFVLTAVVFLMWIHRAYRNLPALGARDLKYSPRWAVGGFFVPFLNVVRPRQVVVEIWKASDPTLVEGYSGQATSSSPLINWWWGLFLLDGFAGNLAGRLTWRGGDTISGLLASSWAWLASDVTEMAAAIVTILLVRAIVTRQEERHLRLALYGRLARYGAVRYTTTAGQTPAARG